MTAERIRKEAEAKKFEMLPEKEKQRRLAGKEKKKEKCHIELDEEARRKIEEEWKIRDEAQRKAIEETERIIEKLRKKYLYETETKSEEPDSEENSSLPEISEDDLKKLLEMRPRTRSIAYNRLFGMMSMEEVTDLYCTTKMDVRQIELMMLKRHSWYGSTRRKRIRDFLDIT